MEHQGGKSLPLSGEFSSSSRRDYEVFLSFRGPDTRLTITDSLYEAMIQAGIHVFKDDEELRVGEEIGGELLRAISTSKIYVPIFSKDYASSKWCLRELAYMVECRKRDKKVILPIFYGVDASDLKLRTGSYGKALRKHERQSSEDTVKQWEEVLREVAKIKGYNLKDHGLNKLIRLVVEEVYSKLRPPQTNWCDGLVGIHNQMEAVMKLLSLGISDVRFIVIYGMGGIGKTTLAKAIFKRISSQFQSCSFLSNIRDKDISSLQEKLLRDILGIRRLEVIDSDEGRDMIEKRLNNKNVILVLDDMDKRDQLEKLAGESSWFGLGSRIIITTRNTNFLAPETDDNIIPPNHKDFFFYETRELQFHHALQLFNKCSFKNDSPPHDYIDISHEIVKTTGGLPLALEVIGSSLHLKCMRTWKDILKKLKEVPNPDVQKKLLISYNELDNDKKQIFLDIACHCIDEERILAHYMWKACGFFPKTELNVLIHLSLIKVIEDDKLWMHDQLRDLGRDIVRQEGILHLGRCSRLWHPRDALNVVQNHMETENIKALKLMGLADGHNFTREEFSRLPSLRFLELDGGNFEGDFKNLLLNLTWLSWCHCPLNLQANSLCLKNLAVLKLSENDITEDWNGWGPCMVNDNLKVIYLTSCKRLMRTPDFSKCTNLKRLVIKDCELLEEINSSIGQLGCLKYLEISEEPRRWMAYKADISVPPPLLPDSIGGLKSLSTLKVENLNKVKALPHSIGELLSLKHMSLSGCFFLRKLPDSVGELRSLLSLDLSSTNISALPDSIGRLESLIKIDLSRSSIAELPNSIGNLRRLKYMCLNWTSIRELPKSIWTLENLEELTARRCCYLEGKIPSEIVGLSQLMILNLSKSKVSGVPTTINRLSNLRELVLTNCNGLQSIPDLPTSLTKLKLSSSPLQAVPDLPCRLPTSLTKLKLSSSPLQAVPDLPCRHSLSSSFFLSFFWVGLSSSFPLLSLAYFLYCRQYSKLEWLGRLHKLQTLRLVFPNFNLPPTDLSSLSQLRSLKITCRDPRSLTRLPSSLENLCLKDVKTPIEWPLFSNLGNLSELKLFRCQLREIEFDNLLGQLENLRRLQVRKCERLVRLSNLASLKELRVLSVEYCPQLLEMESPKLEKLRSLRVYYCESVQKLPDIPNACEVEFYPQR